MAPSDGKVELVRARTADFDELVHGLLGWQADFRPLDPSTCASQINGVRTGGVQICEAFFAPRVLQTGATPSGSRTFGLPVAEFSFHGRAVNESHLLAFHGSGDVACTSHPGFQGYAVTISDPVLEATAEKLGLPELSELLGPGAPAFRREPRELEATRRLLRQILRAPEERVSGLLREADLPARLLELADRSRARSPGMASSPRRARALDLAEAYVREHAREPIKVRDLCAAAGVSERTLRYAFRQRHGVGPKTYLRSLRLTEVRRALRRADPGTVGVLDLAADWGFWHTGQFAADYQRMFGELPSETLRSPRPDGRAGRAAG